MSETFLTLPLRDLRDAETAARFAELDQAHSERQAQAYLLQLAGPARKALRNLPPVSDGNFRRDMGLRK